DFLSCAWNNPSRRTINKFELPAKEKVTFGNRLIVGSTRSNILPVGDYLSKDLGCGFLVLVLSIPVEDKLFESEFTSFLVMTRGKPPMLGEIHALSKPVTSNSVPTPQESKVMKNDKVIAPGMFRINHFKTSREPKHVPTNVRASARTKPITVSQPLVITKKDVNSDSNNFKSLANEADTSLAKHKALEMEIEHLLKAVCDECKYDKISYDKAYKDMQQKIERLQAQLGDLKGKRKDTSSVSDTRNPLSQKLENENMKLEFHVLNYARENAHLKATYKNLFDSISTSRAQTQTIIASLQNELQSNIYKNAKLRKQLFNKVSDKKDNTQDTITSNSVSTPQQSKGVKNDKVIAPRLFRINPSKTSREEKHVPNTVSASNRTKPITVSQPHVISKKDVNSDLNGLSSTGVDNTKTRRPQTRSHTKHDRVSSASKSSRSKNKEAEVEEHHRNLLLSKNNKHISSACNNLQIDSQDVIQICLWCVDSGCSKHMTGNLKLLINFIWKFMGTVRFENDHVAAILGFVERINRTLVEAARTMVNFSHTPLFLWSEAIATACFTQNRFIIHRHFNKTPYELINGRKPDISFLYVFGALCYPKNDREDIGKLCAKAMYDDYIGGRQSVTARTVPAAQEPQVRQTLTTFTSIADTVPTPTNSSSHATNITITSQDVDELNPNALFDGNTFFNPFANSSTSTAESSCKMWIHRTCIHFINHTLTNFNGLRITLWNKC
nr:retrovirus-related Pol polyprotein from transposon TNT 1-94 [Tanacetum cinerariifolium]